MPTDDRGTQPTTATPRIPAWLPPGREVTAVLGLGSNVGDRLAHLQAAIDVLAADRRTRVEVVSGVYETDPVGGVAQDSFLNAAVRVATRRSPAGLLRLARRAEAERGRVREQRWGPRTLDVDLLLYGQVAVASRRLVVPHPRLAERTFALVPAAEVVPDARLPDGRGLAELLVALAPLDGVAEVGRQLRVPADDVAAGGRSPRPRRTPEQQRPEARAPEPKRPESRAPGRRP